MMNKLKSRTLATFGIIMYVLGIVLSAKDLQGNPRFPPILELMAGVGLLAFIIMAVVRLFKTVKYAALTLMLLTILYFVFGIIEEAGWTNLIVLFNLNKLVYLFAFFWVIAKLFQGEAVVGITEKLGKLIALMSVPLLILNIFGDIVAGIWLAVLGDWKVFWYGILAMFTSHFPLSFLLMVPLIFTLPAQYFINKKNKIGTLACVFFSLFYTLALITIWSVTILWFFINSATSQNIIPRLIWSYGIAMSPWMFFAQKDQQGGGNEYSMLSLFFAEIAYVIAILMVIFLEVNISSILIIFGVIMGICLIIEMAMGIESYKISEQ